MKILLIGPYAPHGQVGAIRVLSLSRFLVNAGHDVSVLCLSEKSVKKMDAKGLTATIPENVKLYTYDITTNCNSTVKKTAINAKEFRAVLRKLLLKERFDSAIVSVGPFYTLNALDELQRTKIPYILDYRDLNISSADKRKRKGVINKLKMILSFPGMFSREKKGLKNADYVTVVSEEMKNNLVDYFHVEKEKVFVAYNGFDDYLLSEFSNAQSDNEYFTIGYFGKLMYYNKDLTVKLFEAIDKLNSSNNTVKFLHIGPENPAINSYFTESGLNKTGWYSCTGQMDYAEGVQRLSNCDVCALEYAYYEGPGTKVFDYIYLNKPIIGVTKPGIPLEKLLKRFDNGFVCHDTNEVMKAIQEIRQRKIKCLIEDEQPEAVIYGYSRSKQNEVFGKLLENVNRG